MLSTLFFLLALLAYHRYAARPSIGGWGLVFLAMGFGLLAKPMLVTLPFVLLLLDYWPLGRWEGESGRVSEGANNIEDLKSEISDFRLAGRTGNPAASTRRTWQAVSLGTFSLPRNFRCSRCPSRRPG